MSLDIEIDRGEWAKSLLESEFWEESQEAVRHWALEQMRANPSDPVALQEAAHMLIAIEKHDRYLRQSIEAGKYATHELENRDGRKK